MPRSWCWGKAVRVCRAALKKTYIWSTTIGREREKTGMAWTQPHWHTSSTKATPTNLSLIVLPAGYHKFKYMSPWGAFLFKLPHLSSVYYLFLTYHIIYWSIYFLFITILSFIYILCHHHLSILLNTHLPAILFGFTCCFQSFASPPTLHGILCHFKTLWMQQRINPRVLCLLIFNVCWMSKFTFT